MSTPIAISLQVGQTLNYALPLPGGSYMYYTFTGRLPNGLTFTAPASDGYATIISGTCADLAGSYSIIALGAGSLSQEIDFTVTNANPLSAPVISCLGATTGTPNTLTVAAGDAALLFSATQSGSGWTLVSNAPLFIDGNGKVTGTLAPGIYSVLVHCSNSPYTGSPTQQFASYTLTLTVTPAIPVVTINDAGTLNATVGAAISTAFAVQATAGTVTWSATGLPNGCSINPTSGQVIGMTQIAGTYAATITATNTTGSGSFAANFVIASPTGSNAPAFAFLATDPTLTAVQIDMQTGAVTCARTTPFKFGELARFSLIFLQQAAPVAPPTAATTKIGFCKNLDYGSDYVIPLPTLSLVAASGTAPAYLLAEVLMVGDALEAELKKLIDAQGDGKFTIMSDVCWKANGNPRSSGTFTFDVLPAVTSY